MRSRALLLLMFESAYFCKEYLFFVIVSAKVQIFGIVVMFLIAEFNCGWMFVRKGENLCYIVDVGIATVLGGCYGEAILMMFLY